MEITRKMLMEHLGFTEEKEACGRGRPLYKKAGLYLSYWVGHGWQWQVGDKQWFDLNWLPLQNPSVKFIVRVLEALGETVPVSLVETVNFSESGKFQWGHCWKLLGDKLSETLALNVTVGEERIVVINLNGGRNERLFRIQLKTYRNKKGAPSQKLNLDLEPYNLPITNASSLLAKCLDIIKQSSFADDISVLSIDDTEHFEAYAKFHTFEGWMILSVVNESNEE